MAKDKTPLTLSPRENTQLIGHEAVQAQLLREAESGKLHHAYLLCGAKGIGKATLAYRVARYLLNRGAVQAKAQEAPSFSLFGDAPEPVNNSSPAAHTLEIPTDSSLFRRVASGSHTDLLVIEPPYDDKKGAYKDIITIEEARKVPEFLSLTPAESDWRVVIVDCVDQLNVNAANGLLKILEEPPPRAILLLVCHQPQAILPTIRSRCRQLHLSAPNPAQFEQILQTVAPNIMLHEYQPLYGLSDGSPGFAITLQATDGLEWYRRWLDAMQPDASAQTRQQLADKISAQKNPETWRTVLYTFDIALQRLIRLEYLAKDGWIVDGEGDKLATIAADMPPDARAAWRKKAFKLLSVTDVFNLDKRQTINMLLSPHLLDSMAA